MGRVERNRTVKKSIVTLIGTTLAATAIAAPAYGDTVDPTVVWNTPQNVGSGVKLAIKGPKDVWGARKAAEAYDAQTDHFEIYTEVDDACAVHPKAYCIRITKEHAGDQWWGITYGEGFGKHIVLNIDQPREVSVGCHELSHAIGLDHHTREGCVANYAFTNWDLPTQIEIDAVKTYYEAQYDPNWVNPYPTVRKLKKK